MIDFEKEVNLEEKKNKSSELSTYITYKKFLDSVRNSTFEYANMFFHICNYNNNCFFRKIKDIEYSNKKVNKYEEDARKFINQFNSKRCRIVGEEKLYKKFIYLVDAEGFASSLLDLDYLLELFEKMGIESFVDSRTDTLYWNVEPKRKKTMTLS